ncbi:unnamed protein product [Spirodela intermedia]|uniref:Uncharacterized protein n=1 Tax=Spirodela intermedia TaxID=51605 RepID=A0ABN7EBH6_SPIIN|nr:unnamed protein product [Spirodela intermedia]
MEQRRIIDEIPAPPLGEAQQRSDLRSLGAALISASFGLLFALPQLSVSALIFPCLLLYLGFVLVGLSFAPGRPPELPLLENLVVIYTSWSVGLTSTIWIHFGNFHIALLLISTTGQLFRRLNPRRA